MQSSKTPRYETRSVVERKFWLVWRDKHLRQRIFYHKRPSRKALDGNKACYLNYMDALLYAPFKMTLKGWGVENAVELGNLALVKWLFKTHPELFYSDIIDLAASSGHLEVVKWLCEHCSEENGPTTDAMDYAARNGFLEIVKWLSANTSAGCTKDAMDWAALNGHYEVVKWLCETRSEGGTEQVLGVVMKYNRSEIVKYLEKKKPWLWAPLK